MPMHSDVCALLRENYVHGPSLQIVQTHPEVVQQNYLQKPDKSPTPNGGNVQSAHMAPCSPMKLNPSSPCLNDGTCSETIRIRSNPTQDKRLAPHAADFKFMHRTMAHTRLLWNLKVQSKHIQEWFSQPT